MESWVKITKSGDGYILLAGKGDYPSHTMREKDLGKIFERVEEIFKNSNKTNEITR